MAKLGFGPGREVESIQSVGDITVITLPGGIQTKISNDEAKYRERLAEVITKDGYDNVVEQVAYTWFNRLIAIRYMEVNDFLPTHVRAQGRRSPGRAVLEDVHIRMQIPQQDPPRTVHAHQAVREHAPESLIHQPGQCRQITRR